VLVAIAATWGLNGQALNPGGGFIFGNFACRPNTVAAGPATGTFSSAPICRGLVTADLPALSFSFLTGQISPYQIPATINANTTGNADTASTAFAFEVATAPTNLPSTCTVGQVYYVATVTPGVYVCSANTWTLQGGGGGGTTVPVFSSAEVPSGAIDGNNNTFTLAAAPNPPSSLAIYVNGLLMLQGTDYTLSGSTVLFMTLSIPGAGSTMQAWYQAGWSNQPPVTAFTSFQGTTSSFAPGGSEVTIYSVSAPALAAGACYSIEYGLMGLSGATVKIKVDGTMVSEPSAGFTAADLSAQVRYCNNTGTQNSQTLFYTQPVFYAVSSGFPQNGTAPGAENWVNTPSAINWSTGHTITLTLQQASGSVAGAYFHLAVQ
jgi:hypothetical protein